ncbi:MAG: ThuA domain-containing protein, partial [Verrucomicrobiae bacterium]|nr:ThuA domain-containing protein [Verrucomicrobiae bacterium]
RTTSHAFKYPSGHPLEKWNAFGEFTLGTPPGWGGAAGHTHYGHKSSTDVYIAPGAEGHPILKGVAKNFHCRSWLYKVLPMYPPKDATVLLMGKAVEPNKPAEDNPVAWTWKNQWGGRAFYTSLGHPEDFQVESVQRLVINAIHWALGLPVPDKLAGKMTFNIAYGQHRVPAAR